MCYSVFDVLMKLARKNIPRSHDKSLRNFSGASIRNRYDGAVCNTFMPKKAGLELCGRDLMALRSIPISVCYVCSSHGNIGYLHFDQFLETVNDP